MKWLCVINCFLYLSKKITLTLLVLSLVGCGRFFGRDGFFRDRLGDYGQEEVVPILKMPKGLGPIPLDAQYVIPGKPLLKTTTAQKIKPSEKFVVPRSELSLEQSDGSFYRLELNKNPKRLWVSKNTLTLWPALLDYLKSKNIELTINNKKNRMLLTAPVVLTNYISEKKDKQKASSWDYILSHWLDKKNFKQVSRYTTKKEVRLKLLLRTEKAPGESIIMVSPILESIKEDSRTVDMESANEEGSIETLVTSSILSDLAIFLAQEEATGINAFLLEDEQANLNVLSNIEEDGNGLPVLNIRNISFARGWKAVEKALRAAKIKITDKNRSAGLYYVQWNSEQFKAKTKGNKKTHKTKLSKEDVSYRVRVGVASELVQISIEENSTSAASLSTSGQLLDIIKANLR